MWLLWGAGLVRDERPHGPPSGRLAWAEALLHVAASSQILAVVSAEMPDAGMLRCRVPTRVLLKLVSDGVNAAASDLGTFSSREGQVWARGCARACLPFSPW